jgi:hypothetical protein
MSDSSSSSGGIGLCTALLLVFIVLKLTGHIDWTWFWVLSPYWIPWSIALLVFAVWGAVLAVGYARDWYARRRTHGF